MKKKRGQRTRRSIAALKGKKKPGESSADIRARYRHQHPEHAMVAILGMIDRARQLTGKLLGSAREAENIVAAHRTHCARELDQLWNKLRAENNGQPPEREVWLPARDRLLEQFESADQQSRIEQGEQPSAWLRLVKDFERAVLNRDASWFKAQARAIRGVGFHQTHGADRQRFEVAVLCELQYGPKGMTAQDILDRLEQHREGKHLIIEGCRFSSARRCRAEIKRLAEREGKKLD
jgi:hypothetical protein